MTELRWILLAAGILILVAVYAFWGRRPNRETELTTPRRAPFLDTTRAAPPSRPAKKPVVARADADAPVERDPLPADPAVETEPEADSADILLQAPGAEGNAPAEPYQQSLIPEADDGSQMLVTLHVAAAKGRRFAGASVIEALEQTALRYGRLGIYHREIGGRARFSVANMVEPGTLDPSKMTDTLTPGVSLFMQVTPSGDSAAAFDDMVATARKLAAALDGEVRDEHHSSLSGQTMRYLREEVVAFQSRFRAARPARR